MTLKRILGRLLKNPLLTADKVIKITDRTGSDYWLALFDGNPGIYWYIYQGKAYRPQEVGHLVIDQTSIKTWVVSNTDIEKPFRSRGLGRQIVQTMLAEAQRRKIERITGWIEDYDLAETPHLLKF